MSKNIFLLHHHAQTHKTRENSSETSAANINTLNVDIADMKERIKRTNVNLGAEKKVKTQEKNSSNQPVNRITNNTVLTLLVCIYSFGISLYLNSIFSKQTKNMISFTQIPCINSWSSGAYPAILGWRQGYTTCVTRTSCQYNVSHFWNTFYRKVSHKLTKVHIASSHSKHC